MSVFLIYFEQNSQGGSWDVFIKDHNKQGVVEGFNCILNKKWPILRIDKIQVMFKGQYITGGIISDGTSSGQLLLKKETTNIHKQRNLILSFFSRRLTNASQNTYVFFHFFDCVEIKELVIEEGVKEEVISIEKMNFSLLNTEVLYQITS